MQATASDDPWTPVINGKVNPEGNWTCPTCNRSVIIHPNYVKLGISGCAGRGKCFEHEDVAKAMVTCRNWTFKSYDKNPNTPATVYFICSSGHEMSIKYEGLRKGSGCRKCSDVSKVKPVNTIPRLKRVECECWNGRGGRLLVCPHHNHTVCKRGGAEEWNYELNGDLKPTSLGPTSKVLCWYTCPHVWCRMNYQQRPGDRVTGSRCFYCSGQRVCKWNCLLTRYPELCLELDPNNDIKPDQITPGVDTKLGWLCHNHRTSSAEPPFRYEASVRHRTVNGSGCPRCNRIGGNQMVLGHEEFVRLSNIVHGNKYEYSDRYQGAYIPVTVRCNSIVKFSDPPIPHGDFKVIPHSHKHGTGCPICISETNDSSYVVTVQRILDELGYVAGEKCFPNRQFTGMIYRRPLFVDRYIPSEKLAIEIDGGYHFSLTNRGEEILRETQLRDVIKDKYLIENKINILRIPYPYTFDYLATKKLIMDMIELCRTGKQVYVTYKHYYEALSSVIDLKGITVILLASPLD